MADDITPIQQADPVRDPAVLEPQPEPDQSRQRSLWGLLGVVSLIVIVILLLLLLSRCGGDRDGVGDGGGKSIEPVVGYEPVPGLVSVWLAEDTAVETVMSRSGVDGRATLDTGGGRWVVEVTPGSEKAAAAALREANGVYDAGLVYEAEPGR